MHANMHGKNASYMYMYKVITIVNKTCKPIPQISLFLSCLIELLHCIHVKLYIGKVLKCNCFLENRKYNCFLKFGLAFYLLNKGVFQIKLYLLSFF